MIDFAPLKKDQKDFWFWYDEFASLDIDGDRSDVYYEISLSLNNAEYSLEYSDNNMNIEVYRGDIPNREFFEQLLKNCEGIKDLKL